MYSDGMGSRADVVAEELFESLGVLRRQVRAAVGRPWADAELSGAEVDVVRLVRRRPGVSIAQAAAVLGLAANSVSTLARRLGGTGWLVGERDGEDRRVVRLHLTEPARSRVEQWRDRRGVLVGRAMRSLDPDDVDAIEAALPALARLTEALRDDQALRQEPASGADPTSAAGPDRRP